MTTHEQFARIRDMLFEVVQAAIEVNMSPESFIKELRQSWSEARQRQKELEERYLNNLQL